MCAVFGTKSYETTYYDGVTLADGYEDRPFTARITVCDGRSMDAIQGGRIIGFVLFDYDSEILCIFRNGKWEMEMDPNDGIGQFAMSHFISEYNSPSRTPTRLKSSMRYVNALYGSGKHPPEDKILVPEPYLYSRKKHLA